MAASPNPVARAAVLFVVGAVVGTLCDQIHVVGHVIHYPASDVLGIPWWVPPQYGLAAVAFTLPVPRTLAMFGLVESRISMKSLAIPAIWFVGAYVATAVFQAWPVALGLVFLGTFLARVRRDGGLPVLVHGLACAIGGVTWECVISTRGLFVYDAPTAFGLVPWWLPGLYLHASLLTRQIARTMAPEAAADVGIAS